MLYPIIALLLGFIILVWSADRFVIGAAGTAKNMGMSPMLIGLTVVSFGTSAPEILVSIMAATTGAGDLAVGNALGSNIANIGLVLGMTALIAPLPVRSKVLKQEIPLLLAITLLAGAVLYDLYLGHIDSIILCLSLVVCLYLFTRFQRNASDDEINDEEDELPELSTPWAIFWLIAGLLLLAGSSRLLVWGATEIATTLGVSDLIIGLTIVAIGTSLPELAASVASALKGHTDIALGNIVGSNIFNIAAVMAVPGLLAPIELDPAVLWRDYGSMLGLTLLLVALAVYQRPPKISRVEGGILLAAYAGYLALLYNMSV
ncbi:calcium/sodium antiporter [Amphritea sp. 2_MG-2023]|uniref:calcium/sodium antiporter n=1 Tax=Amphritea TaxID=515417 RepID=UPI001C07582E|nr:MULTISPECIES: calcium/sodium antiporter [Amphritea]MBU2966118.1 calcium/sodium antiporter [Amphritea atlantica]MDO6418227.1 calcium/sodium antiporter [Amphritea sp. 2_MG-2023]